MYNHSAFVVDKIKCSYVLQKAMKGLSEEITCIMAYTDIEEVDDNDIIRRQIIAGLQRTGYRKIPRIMMRHLTIISTEKLNDFPVDGMLDEYSPNQKMRHGTYGGTEDYLCEFGRRVGVNNDIHASTYEAIYLRRNYNM